MKKICLAICLLVVSATGFTQDEKIIDSLITELNRAGEKEKIGIMLELSDQFIYTEEDSAENLALRAYFLAKKISANEQLAAAAFQLGKVYYHHDSLDLSLNYLLEAQPIMESSGDSSNIFKLYNYLGYVYFDKQEFENALKYQSLSIDIEKDIANKSELASRLVDIGMVYEYTGDYEKALAYYNQALKVQRELNEVEAIAGSLNNLANVYQTFGNYEKALIYYLEALEIYDRLQDQNGIAIINNNIGIVYHDWKQYDKALEYYIRGLEIEKMLENKRGIAQSLNNIAIIYDDKGNRKQALEYYLESLRMAEELNDKMSMAIAMSNLGEYYTKDKDFSKALQYHLRSIALDQEMGNQISLGESYTSLGELYFRMGDYNKSLQYYHDGLQIMEEQQILPSMADSYKGMSEVYAQIREYRKAYEYNKLYTKINDSIFSESMAKRLSMLQTGYEIESRENEIKLLNQEKEKKELQLELNRQQIRRQQIIGLGLIIAFTVFLGLSLLLYRQVRQKKKAFETLVKQHKEIQKNREELILAKEKAEESDRLKSAFLLNLSHEIRTPMNGIVGFSNILKNSGVKEEEKQYYLEMIQSNTRQLLVLISNIIDISAIQTGQLSLGAEKVNPEQLIRDAWEDFRREQPLIGKENIDFRLKLEPMKHVGTLYADGKRLRQILDNLLDNAFKYTKEGYVELSGMTRKNSLIISVSDSGIGIPKDKQDIIFENFRQVDDSSTRKYGGTGLGLAIIREVVKLMGGNVSVESESGKGSTFRVEIPMDRMKQANS
ncbi:MAG: tetratricopeptide repeat protein [Bacteroidetes bacterium]|nr:tetratricopeptide repeat protein [Bacteroidota bacterium]